MNDMVGELRIIMNLVTNRSTKAMNLICSTTFDTRCVEKGSISISDIELVDSRFCSPKLSFPLKDIV